LAEATNEASKRGNKKLTAYHLYVLISISFFSHIRSLSIPFQKGRDDLNEKIRTELSLRKTTINQNDTFDFLREIVSTIPDPTESETPTQGGRKPRAKAQSQSQSQSHSRPGTSAAGAGYGGETIPESKPESMPDIGTWKKEGGTGEGGRGMFDDYEDDEDY
jgi:hypothetical protein